MDSLKPPLLTVYAPVRQYHRKRVGECPAAEQSGSASGSETSVPLHDETPAVLGSHKPLQSLDPLGHTCQKEV